MTLTVAHHAPYTVEDLFEMPDDGNRYEVLEGALIVSPSPDFWHQIIGDRLQTALEAAAPQGVMVLTAITVRLGGDETGLVPDVVVTGVDPASRPKLLDPADVLAVVEVVSPSSGTHDRVLKPDRYASFGIDCFWRVELDAFPGQGDDALPVVLVHERTGTAYREVQRLAAGRADTTRLPFAARLDPADLLRGAR